MKPLFKRNVAKRLWREFNEGLEPLNRQLKKQLGFPRRNRNVLWDELAFNPATHMYAQALNSFHCGALEASTVMCRDAIDSALYLASTIVRTEDPTASEFRDTSAILSDTRWDWKMLRRYAIDLRLLTHDDIALVEEIRKAGNFSAHIAEMQDKQSRLLDKRYREDLNRRNRGISLQPKPPHDRFKRWTVPEEALLILTQTKVVLSKIIQNYFTSEQTFGKLRDSH